MQYRSSNISAEGFSIDSVIIPQSNLVGMAASKLIHMPCAWPHPTTLTIASVFSSSKNTIGQQERRPFDDLEVGASVNHSNTNV